MLDATTAAPTIRGMYIGGRWVPAARTFDDLNPSDNSLYARIPDASREDMARAIEAAQAAFPAWSALPFTERAKALLKVAEVWERRAPDFVAAAVAEGGGWYGKGVFEAGYVAGVFRAAAALCYHSTGELLPSEHGKLSMATRWPLGVVSVISPWNMPGILTSRGFAAALAVGNTVVLKPSEDTPYAGGLYFAEILEEAGIPAGVFNVVTCSRESVAEVGDEMIEHPYVKAISFTGSTAVGRHIAAKAGAYLKKACVELGGKDSMIVFEDADLDAAARAANFGSFMHQGQVCMSTEKLLVQESVYDEFMKKFLARAARLKTGHTADKENVIGPLVNARQAQRVKRLIDDAVAKGARIELGGKAWDNFVEPTVLTNVNSTMDIWHEETFGPVVIVCPFRTEEEAIALNNDTEYGLTAAIWTRDEARALRIAGQLETGMVHVNCQNINDEPHVPFGGVKASGVGRYGGRWSLDAFTELRWITLDRGGRHFPPQF
ncbi:aldehyde dehydrogenase (NAD+) [Meinhardsimonia xiamenensis]|jgi:aldehyde dehydrogenase (NAD+)|uniref:Aldehyde dehydrogenase (NAD+) n=1 Tax=Meinhardsimonia xiamenensis TaxID=990712 RepID=A0A1G9AYU2_9RHOB|nr:aldehyde dehydrogenase family protein [Meinhardsimonia xiamenensis]PRX35214.1 aldehyde dehydrogenase (NAD+) [Meinhardsimonia xiamenensis]SDK31850.1 aldehyde dehydrogenase (NAD+) [Meinhardsimonia xiamenensis]